MKIPSLIETSNSLEMKNKRFQIYTMRQSTPDLLEAFIFCQRFFPQLYSNVDSLGDNKSFFSQFYGW